MPAILPFRNPRQLRGVLLAALLAAAAPLAAAICNVPTTGYPTLAAALADPTCDPIQVAAGTLTESPAITRDVTIAGTGSGSTTIAGWVSVTGAATDAVLGALRIDATSASAPLCYASGLDVRGGAKASGLDLVVVGRPTPTSTCGFFADGFESGDTAAWSARRP
ncbi:MAG: hypothetical protein KJ058_08750 [Thermoanaerobaculia bacterium]|nr:hypothetical protein [Thermoanaerobaculia bacterium]